MSGLAARIAVASAALALLLVAGGAIMLAAIADQHDAAEQARRAQSVLTAANGVERLVVDLETGVRGFLLTGEDRFLEPWERARQDLPERLAQLEGMVAGDPAQAELVRQIDRTTRELIVEHQAPLVALARRDRPAARRTTALGERKQIVDDLRARFQTFAAREERRAVERDRDADAAKTRALWIGGGFTAGALALVVLYALYVMRTLVRPVRRVARGAAAIAGGDLSVRVPPQGAGEVGDLGRSFNTMAESLAEARAELESQNVELEHQQAEVESQNVELEQQQSELEQALEALGEEKERAETFYEFGERLVSVPLLGERAEIALAQICDLVEADVGALYCVREPNAPPMLMAARGLRTDRLAPELAAGDGLAGRAFAEQRAVVASHGEAGLRAAAFGDEAVARHELHVPLVYATRRIGVISLARLVDRPFSQATVGLATQLAGQATVALDNARALRSARRQAAITMAVLDATPDGIALISPEGRALLVNDAINRLAEEAFDLPKGVDFWRAARDVATRTTDPEGFIARLEELRRDPDLQSFDEFQMRDGRAFQRYATVVRTAEGEPIGRLFVLHEVTAEREAQRARDEFTALVSHELRTPLTSIMGFVELLKVEGGGEMTDEQRHYVEIVGRNAERLLRLVDDILLMARADAGRMRLETQPVDVGGLVAECVEGARPRADEAGVDLRLVGPAEALPPVEGDRARLGQVVDNLVSNAIKFTPRGGSAEVRVAAPDGQVEVVVSDTGIGIPPEERERLFERFFRARSATEAGIAGTGLGLAVSRAIVEAHGGSVTLDPPGPRGTTFRVRLPVRHPGGGEADGS